MSKLKEKCYSVPLENSDKKDNETYVYKSQDALKIDLNNYQTEFSTLHDCYKKWLLNRGNERCIGERQIHSDNSLDNDFKWYTKSYVREMSEAIGSGFVTLNLAKPLIWENREIKIASLYSKNSPLSIFIDIAMTMQGIAILPIYDNLGEDAIEYILKQTKTISCFITVSHIKDILNGRKEQKRYKYLQFLIVIDAEKLTAELKKEAKQYFIVYTLTELIEEGRKNKQVWANVTPETVYSISYTNSTTGPPKGSVITHRNLVSTFSGLNRFRITSSDVYLLYLPLASIFERVILNYFLLKNVKIGISEGDIYQIKEDLLILKPTIFISLPRYFNELYKLIKTNMTKISGFKKSLANKAILTKQQSLTKKSSIKHFFYDSLVFGDMKKEFGGKIRMMFAIAGHISEEITDYLKIVFSCPIIEVYGQTESCGFMSCNYINDYLSGHVGAPFIYNEFKLVDIPEMNYTTKDTDDKGRYRPRGEIWIRGPNIIPGYISYNEETQNSFTTDGWFKTGDIGQVLPEKNRLQIIDKKRNIIKLSDALYISPEHYETAYLNACEFFNDIYIYCDPSKDKLIAILNIYSNNIKLIISELKLATMDFDVNSEEMHNTVMNLLNGEAKRRQFSKFEYIHRIYIETRPFKDLKLLTTMYKKKRHKFKVFYRNEISAMCETL